MAQRKRTATDATVSNVEIGARLRRRRSALGMTQQQLGDAIGVSFQQIQKYESGRNRIASDTLQVLAATLGISPLYFLAADGDAQHEAGTLAAPDPGLARLVAAYTNCKRPKLKAHLLLLLEERCSESP